MAESLEDFLNVKKKYSEVTGSLSCQECEEIVSVGSLDEDSMILYYVCSKNHQSKVKM
jgi:hypothetical protein